MSKPVKKTKKLTTVVETSEKPQEPVTNVLVQIHDELDKLQELSSSSTANMSDILQLHNSLNSNVDQLAQRVDKIRNDFLNIKHKPLKDIDNITYQKYMDEITSLQGEIDADTDIEELIKQYENAVYKINLCGNFLKSKQMTVTYCDNKPDEEDE